MKNEININIFFFVMVNADNLVRISLLLFLLVEQCSMNIEHSALSITNAQFYFETEHRILNIIFFFCCILCIICVSILTNCMHFSLNAMQYYALHFTLLLQYSSNSFIYIQRNKREEGKREIIFYERKWY